jgi:hypothetical protein
MVRGPSSDLSSYVQKSRLLRSADIARRMALLSMRYHVNLANACSGLNEENRVASAFLWAFLSRSVGGERCREPSGAIKVENGVRVGFAGQIFEAV